jgi:Reverse transcriptase (RNA-dependent DNA polymerase).
MLQVTGHYEYNRMSYGLKAAPATFQRMMNTILREALKEPCFVYTDDILITGESLKEHKEKLEDVFTQIRKYSLKIEPDKCATQGVQPDKKKVSAVQAFPKPQQPGR